MSSGWWPNGDYQGKDKLETTWQLGGAYFDQWKNGGMMTQDQSDQACQEIQNRVNASFLGKAKAALDSAGPNGVICFQVEASSYPDIAKYGPKGATQVKLELWMHTIKNVRGSDMKCVHPLPPCREQRPTHE